MKKENKFLEFLNSKGFYTALFTCLFAVLAIAAFVSIKNIDAISKLTTYGEEDLTALDAELQSAVAQTDTPVSELGAELENLDAEDGERSVRKTETPDDSVQRIKTEDKASETNKPKDTSGNTSQSEQAAVPKKDDTAETDKGTDNNTKEDSKNEASAEAEVKAEKPEDAEKSEKPEAKEVPEAAPKTDENAKPAADASFAESDMDWPLDGAIVMDFSNARAIYDKTLDQYRTNPTVSIGSEVGTQVKAAANGIVKSISIDPRTGYTVILDHGNGWQTQYGQLQETILVQEGQSVSKGQAIGGVGTPTKYGVLLGSHLVFGISKDDVPQNPKVVMLETEE